MGLNHGFEPILPRHRMKYSNLKGQFSLEIGSRHFKAHFPEKFGNTNLQKVGKHWKFETPLLKGFGSWISYQVAARTWRRSRERPDAEGKSAVCWNFETWVIYFGWQDPWLVKGWFSCLIHGEWSMKRKVGHQGVASVESWGIRYHFYPPFGQRLIFWPPTTTFDDLFQKKSHQGPSSKPLAASSMTIPSPKHGTIPWSHSIPSQLKVAELVKRAMRTMVKGTCILRWDLPQTSESSELCRFQTLWLSNQKLEISHRWTMKVPFHSNRSSEYLLDMRWKDKVLTTSTTSIQIQTSQKRIKNMMRYRNSKSCYTYNHFL